MAKQFRFILIDDDEVANMINNYTITAIIPDAHIDAFTSPHDALDFIKNKVDTTKGEVPIILLLDLNMPLMDGWEFLDEFAKMDNDIQRKFIIYVLTSSISEKDEETANANPYVEGFISKPLEESKVGEITGL